MIFLLFFYVSTCLHVCVDVFFPDLNLLVSTTCQFWFCCCGSFCVVKVSTCLHLSVDMFFLIQTICIFLVYYPVYTCQFQFCCCNNFGLVKVSTCYQQTFFPFCFLQIKKWSSVDGSDLNIELVDVNFLDEMQDDVVVVCLINMSQDDHVANNSNGCR